MSAVDSTTKKSRKRKAKKQKVKHTLTESKESISSDLKDYVGKSFQHCISGKQSELEVELKSILLNAKSMTNWKEEQLPRATDGVPQPNNRKRTKNKAIKNVSSSSSSRASSFGTSNSMAPPKTGGIIAVKSTPEELRRREQRLMRFGTPTAKPTPTPAVSSESWSPDGKIIGTSTDLEKPYFRLTSAPDPSTVRPASILQLAYTNVKKKWNNDNNYKYACEQLKSIRQDMTIQGIRDKFAVTIYEYHARMALLMGDLSEYNQCQSQLRELYNDDKITNINSEFIAYEILYLLFSGNRSEMNALLTKRAVAKEQGKPGVKNKSKALKHAQAVRSALAVGNYHKFFQLYQDAPNRNALLMDQFVPRERIKALLMLCKTFPMGLPLDFITKELAFYNTEETVEFLEKHGIKIDHVQARLETKPAVPHLQAAIQNKYQKADIKGQV
ncbi:SAC3/GANP/Nin1/mts3/eIF-3 p25 family-domain-containing protein [Phascolomyces articulosus]|uniref:SAC3/GANP/Nin1/mts3/eIF-3 p25 family-domain-containing protein n=1 Tax=Phascolomyces articulosus TaxID=60185 RepID=A0AAD5KIM8_9FUNG|nr:SAC3/GANP/Nin1/mts3/eIF-3 p25 family-domain-containing protein [Phascolomyces articulosus]